jgi:hypothetical protein
MGMDFSVPVDLVNEYSDDLRIPLSEAKVSEPKNIVYSGSAQTPDVTVTADGEKLKQGVDFEATFSNNTVIGKAHVVITAKGDRFKGSRKHTFNIVPKSIGQLKLKARKKAITVSWKTGKSYIDGYQIQYARKSSFKGAKTISVKGRTAKSKKISRLKAKKKYFVRIRSYKTVDGARYVSAWSKVKTIKTR